LLEQGSREATMSTGLDSGECWIVSGAAADVFGSGWLLPLRIRSSATPSVRATLASGDER